MVTVRQFSRGVGRTVRAMEREGRRAQRQRDLDERAMAKQAYLDASANAADDYQRLLALLTAAHRLPFARRDWASLAAEAPPSDPQPSDTRERAAEADERAYAPGWFATTFGMARRRRAELAQAVRRARAQDEERHRKAVDAAVEKRAAIAFAQALISLDGPSILSAADTCTDLAEAPVEAISVMATDGRVFAVVDAYELEDMPNQTITLLQSGKMSVKPTPPTKLLELHRDNICSSAIRVATEFLQALPVDAVEVLVQTDLLDRGSGHITAQPVLYARITAQALSTVNLVHAEPAPLAERLGAHFDWHRRDGLRPINLDAFNVPSELLATNGDGAQSG